MKVSAQVILMSALSAFVTAQPIFGFLTNLIAPAQAAEITSSVVIDSPIAHDYKGVDFWKHFTDSRNAKEVKTGMTKMQKQEGEGSYSVLFRLTSNILIEFRAPSRYRCRCFIFLYIRSVHE